MTDIRFTVDAADIVLCGRRRVLKTQRFCKQTARYSRIDAILDVLAGGILAHADALPALDNGQFWTATCGEHTFWFSLQRDLVFVGYDSPLVSYVSEDSRFVAFLAANPTFEVRLSAQRADYPADDWAKLYRLSLCDGLYFPCLDKVQRDLVACEDKHVLVQGVAGSGKTNVCIDKILFCAVRAYGGKVMYTTYSRGLLMDTKMRVQQWKQMALDLAEAHRRGRVVVLDDAREGIANRLGIYLDDNPTVAFDMLDRVAQWLDGVQYKLPQDLYADFTGETPDICDENYFVHRYIGEMRNYNLAGRLEKIKDLSAEVIYKEINGLIEGWCDPANPTARLDRAHYAALRRETMGAARCDTIYGIAEDYAKHRVKMGKTDVNALCRAMLSMPLPRYSLIIADEVQDFSQVTLVLLARLTQKMFCVGDALQMINPSYFNFAYLKRLLFDNETARVATLQHNYRSSKRIEAVLTSLGQLNRTRFGVHSFVLQSTVVGDDVDTAAAYVPDQDFLTAMAGADLGDVTVLVGDNAAKRQARKVLPAHEILTVSEIKGLERDTVVLYNLLSDHLAQWQELERSFVDRKTADENSVYRYYFNLFYVGVSRARRHLYVVERRAPALFAPLLQGLDAMPQGQAIAALQRVAGKRLDEAEQRARVEQFLSLGQYDNALVASARLPDAAMQQKRIAIYATQVQAGQYRAAGLAFWQLGAIDDARKCFAMGGETMLANLMDATLAQGESRLDVGMLRHYADLEDNPAARSALVGVVQQELTQLQALRRQVHNAIKSHKKGV